MPTTDDVEAAARWLLDVLTWPFRQVWAGLTNLYRALTEDVTLREILIPSIYSALMWLRVQIPYAFGFDTREHMLTGSFVLAVFAFFFGFISAGATWVLIGVFAFTFAVGLLRFLPVVERYWPL